MLGLMALYKNFIHDGWNHDMWSDEAGYKVAFVILGFCLDALAIISIIMLFMFR